MNVTGTFQNDAMLRQITESVMISQTGEGQLINTKEESGRISGSQERLSRNREIQATNISLYFYCTIETEF